MPAALFRKIVAAGAFIVAALCLSNSSAIHAATCSMDIDGNGRMDANTDGLLMMRYLLGIRGAALTLNALGNGASRTLPDDIEKYLSTPCSQAGWVGKGSGRLNDTGVTFGGEASSGNNADCTSSNTNIAHQDCSNGRDANPALNSSADGIVGFSFTKISNSGNALPSGAALGAGASDWACTFDNVTGLMWEVKTTSGRRSQDHTYTWFSSDASNNAGATGTAAGGVCGDAGQCDTEKYVRLTNSDTLCGRNDWRMPHAKELLSIVRHGPTNPTLHGTWFPNTPGTGFWSGSPFAGGATNAWFVGFFSGGFVSYGPRSNANRARLVRAGQ